MIGEYIEDLCRRTKKASFKLASLDASSINSALEKLKKLIEKKRADIKRSNRIDVELAEKEGLSSAMIDRLLLNDKRIDAMISSLDDIIALRMPVGEIVDGWQIENGLKIEKVRVPIGVIGIVYESRPNVTIDATALCLKSLNAVVLRGGKEAINSNRLLVELVKEALGDAGIDTDAVNFVDKTDREGVLHLCRMDRYMDLIIPRGGEGLIRFVSENATMSVLKHDKGLCHTYIDADADMYKALKIAYNAKVNRPGVCNAMETLLVHESIAYKFLPEFKKLMDEASVELRGCGRTREIVPEVKLASDEDWDIEYLDLILSVKVVKDVNEAIDHINRHGSSHSEAIVTENYSVAEEFLDRVDAACVYVNASTRFTDGGVFGMGAEIGISTNKLHARGPVGLRELTTYKYKIRGEGQIRE